MATVAIFISIIFFIVLPQTASSISEESEALLLLKKSFTNTTSLISWVDGSAPCNGDNSGWRGLVCFHGIVTGLRLGGMGLSGKIDIDALLQIPGIRTLSFVKNSFAGSIPEFNRLGALKAIYLSGNQFSGEIPSDYFVKMESLKKVWLSDNKFSGEIPESIAKLPHLIELHLENNQFSGAVPEWIYPTLVSLNVSNNKLEGAIPTNLSKFNSSSFAGNEDLCGETLQKICQKSTIEVDNSAEANDKHKDNNKIAAGIMTSGAILLSLAVIAIVVLKRRRDEEFNVLQKENQDEEVEISVSGSTKRGSGGSTRKGSNSNHGKASAGAGAIGDLVMVNEEKGVFGLPDLMKAAAEVLGNGGLGSSYKATMTNGVTVVVKRLREMNRLGKEGFDTEAKKLGNLKHLNVLTPLAYHYRKVEKLFVYEFIPGGSLLYLLHGDRGASHLALDWPTRLKITQGIANGLLYIHQELSFSELPHGNLKASNILLTPNNDPLLSEFGYHPFTNSNQASLTLFAHKSPESLKNNQISPKADVYCLGIIILEILTGKFPSQYNANGKGGIDIVQWVASSLSEEKVTELLDPEIANAEITSIVEMEKLLRIGAACTEPNPEQRLDLREAVRLIEEVQIGDTDNGDRDSVNNAAKTMQLLPSLRDGYADSALVAESSTATEGAAAAATRTHRSTGSRDGGYGELQRNDESFAFNVS